MLRAVGYEVVEKKSFPNLDLKITNRDIAFQGLPNTITTAKLHMYEIINSMCTETHRDVPESVCRLLKKRPIKDHLVGCFKSSGMRMIWEAGRQDLTVWATNQDDLANGIKLVMNEVIEAKLRVPDEGKKVCVTAWVDVK